MNTKRKKLLLYSAVFLLLPAIALFASDILITRYARGKLFSDPGKMPDMHCGLLLGTARYLGDGRTVNPYYNKRILAAALLMKNKKLRYLVISGDNGRKSYSEPDDMRNDLIALGVDSSRIFLDYAGFRTFDSVLRLREIFSQKEVCIISQRFHNERALYIARLKGIKAIGFNAEDVSRAFGYKVMLREKFARAKVFVDYFCFTQARFLGPRIAIPKT